MAHKPLLTLRFLILFLAFCFLISSTASVPTTRILKSPLDHPSAQDFASQDARNLEIKVGDSFEFVEERLFEGRMILENTDYPGTGANNHHDPRSPAKP